MNPTRQTLRYTLLIVLILMVSGLAMWYFFLRGQIQGIPRTISPGTTTVSPFGSTGSTYNNVVGGVASTSSSIQTVSSGPVPVLWQVTKTPVAGMSFSGSGIKSTLRFAERSTGYIFDADPTKGSVTRVTNKLFPKTYEALFGPGGSVVLRSISENGAVESFAGVIVASSSPSSSTSSTTPALFTGTLLPPDIGTILLNERDGGLFYLLATAAGGVTGVQSSWDGTKAKSFFSSLLSNWKPFSLADGRMFLLQKPADGMAGSAYELTSTGSLNPILRNLPGLSFLPHESSSAVLFSTSVSGEPQLFSRIESSGSATSIPLKTVADKCVWAPVDTKTKAADPLIAYCAVPDFFSSKNFLNDWYRGVTHTRDQLWKINVRLNTVELVSSLESGGQEIDVENPTIDAQGNAVAFMNAKDKTLWLLRLGATLPSL